MSETPSDYNVTVADRIRASSNSEMATILTNWITGVLSKVLKDTDYEFTPDIQKYEVLITNQLAEITTEKPRAYTIDELKAMRGDKIYIYHINACAGFYGNMYVPYFGNKQSYIEDSVLGLTSVQLPLSHYGASWIAFNYKPQDANGKKMPIAEKLSNYDKQMFHNMTTCQLFNERHRLEDRLADPDISSNLSRILIDELNIVKTELTARHKNDVL